MTDRLATSVAISVAATDTTARVGGAEQLFAGPGEMRALCRELDWAATPLGAVERWSQSLRTTVTTVLGSRNPMVLFWGPELIQFYNDAFRPSLGEEGRHPRALGMRGREFWIETWDTVGPQIAQVMSGGQATWHENQHLSMERNGRLEDVWWTYGYSPVLDDDGSVGGTLVVCQETTQRVLAEREHERLLASAARVERALRETAARYRAIYDGTYEYIGLLAPDGKLLEANRASLGFAGSTREELIGLHFWDTPWFARTPGAAESMRRAVERAAAGEFVRYQAQLRRPSGELSTFDISLHPVRDERDRVVFIVPEGRDITERERAEEARRETEARYRILFESIDEGFCVVDVLFDDQDRPVDYRFLEANPAFLQQSGLENAMGRRMRELAPTHEEHWFERYGRVALTGEPVRFEAPARALHRWYSVYAFRIGRPEERKVAILFNDITAAKVAERERETLLRKLELEKARLAEAFQRSPSFIVVFRGQELHYEFVNEAYFQLVGHRDILGKPLLEALPEIGTQGFKEILDRVLETGEPWVGRETPVLLQRTPGAPLETRYLDMVLQALAEVDGTRSGVVAHGSDVTEQVLARREVERLLLESERARAEAESARAEAETANRAKGEFLAVMSHELRTPLNAIAGYAELIALGIRGPVTVEQQEDLHRIQTSQRHLQGLINEVLNYAKLETGRVSYDLTAVRVGAALQGAEALVAPQAQAKGLSLAPVDCPPTLVALADAEKLQQILVNLLSNAVKFTESGGHIRMSGEVDGDQVRIRIHDTGIGIPADKLEAIFDPFVQVRANLTRPHEGTGLGLAISRDLARGMGGDLAVESAPGAGSTFTLTLQRV